MPRLTIADMIDNPRGAMDSEFRQPFTGSTRPNMPSPQPKTLADMLEMASMSQVPGLSDVASGGLALSDLIKGNYGSAALNGLGALPLIPAMGGIIRGHGTPYLTTEQLVEANKGRGLLSKAQRRQLFNPESGVPMPQQLGEIGNINSEIQQVKSTRKAAAELDRLADITPLEMRPWMREYAQKNGALHDMVDIYKNTPSSLAQAYDSAFRLKKSAEDVAKAQDEIAKRAHEMEWVFSSPSAPSWHKSMADKIKQELDFRGAMGTGKVANDASIDAAARAATLEAITREAKKRGMKVDYISAKSSRSGGSHYIQRPDGKVVRVSDHELPETPQRLFNRAQGLGGRWDKEILVDDWKTSSIDDYISKILSDE